MSRSRLKLLQHPGFGHLAAEVEKHIESWIETSNPAEMAGLLDDVCVDVLVRVFEQIGGSEGTVWLSNSTETALEAVLNTGPDQADIRGFQQPIGSGIISMVYAQQQSYCENDIGAESGHDNTLDRQIHRETRAMIAIPLYFAFGLRGVISCVQLDSPDGAAPKGFEVSDVDHMVKAGNKVERLINGKLLSLALGFDEG